MTAITVLTLSVVALTTAIHLYYSRQLLWNSTLREAELVVRQIYSQSAHALSRTQPGTDPWRELQADRELRALVNASVGYAPWLLYVVVADQNGRAAVHSDHKREGQVIAPLPDFRALVARGGLRPWDLYDDPQVYEVALPFDRDGQPFGAIRLGIAIPFLRAQLDDALRYTVVLGVFALVAALAVALALSSITLKPIRKLAEDMARLRRGEYDVGSAAGPTDEFGKLAYQLQQLGRQMQSDRTKILGERSQLQSGADEMEDGILFIRPDGRVLFANRALETALGRRGVVGHRLEDVLGRDHPLAQLVGPALQPDATPRRATIEIPTDGKPLQLLATVFPLGDGGPRDGLILVLRDLEAVPVSARTFQSLIQYAAQLTALGQITAEVTHDVKNPLHAMMVHVAFLRERLADLPADVRRSLDILEREIHRADGVVNRFVQITRPGEVAMKPVDVNAVLHDIAALLESDWRSRSVEIGAELDPALPSLMGDEELLRRAFLNVVLNACQAMPDGGTVTIRTELQEDGFVQVSISDTGVGMPAEDLERVFAMYYTTKAGGTGVGLPLVRRVVTMHRGDIQLLSTVGRGTTVVIRLPVAQP
jgi:signal transduction histidine kinase/HAMP domain-containing protein